MELPLVVAGAVTGLLVGMTGVGSGALMTPLLLLVFGVVPLTAIGTDLWFAALTKLAATRVHHGHGLIDWQVARRLWMGSLPATVATLGWLTYRPVDAANADFLKIAIAIAVVISALGILAQKRLHAWGRRLRIEVPGGFKAMQGPLTVAAGALLGFLVTLTSVGAGALGAVMLICLYPLRLTPPRLIATDIVHAIPVAIFAGAGHFMVGNVDLALLGNLLLGSIPGVLTGAQLSSRLPHTVLRVVMAGVLLLIGIKLGSTVL